MLKNLFIKFIDKRRETELKSFMKVLKSGDYKDIAVLLCGVMDLRNDTLEKSQYDLMQPALLLQQDPYAIVSFSSIVKKLQKKGKMGQFAAAPYIVWTHTLRAIDTPEIRNSAREMWKELSLGFDHKEEGVRAFMEISGYAPDLTDWGLVPNGLGQRDA